MLDFALLPYYLVDLYKSWQKLIRNAKINWPNSLSVHFMSNISLIDQCAVNNTSLKSVNSRTSD